MFEQDRPSIVEGGARVLAGASHIHIYVSLLPGTNLWPPYYLYINNTDYPPIIQEASHSFTASPRHSAPPGNINLNHTPNLPSILGFASFAQPDDQCGRG